MHLNENLRRVANNVFSLTAIRFFDMVLPLLSIPYLLRVLGIELYGRMAFAMAFIVVFRVIIKYGFNVTATRNVSIVRENTNLISLLASQVIAARLCLLSVIFLICIPLFTGLSIIGYEVKILSAYLIVLIPDALCFAWYYLGMERMATVTLTKFTVKLFYVVGLFLLIKKQEHLIFVPVIEFVTGTLGGMYLLYRVCKYERLNLRIPTWEMIVTQLRDGFSIFVNQVVFILQDQLIPIFLGFFAGASALGVYTPINRILTSLTNLIQPVSIGLFPYLTRSAVNSPQRTMNIVNLCSIILFSILLFVGAFIIFLAPQIVMFLYGKENMIAVSVLRWSAFLPAIIALRRFLALQGLVGFNKDVLSMKVSLYTLTIVCIGSPLFINSYEIFGAVMIRFLSAFIGLAIIIYYYLLHVIKRSDSQFSLKIF